jgi:hypothetical protein
MIRDTLATITFGLACLAMPSTALAATNISTSAFGLFGDVGVVAAEAFIIGPVGNVGGSTSPGYNRSAVSDISLSRSFGALGDVVAGYDLLTDVAASATANGTTPLDTSFGQGSATATSVLLDLLTARLGMPAVYNLRLFADSVGSETTVSRIGEVATLTGTSTFSNLDFDVPGLLDFSLGANAQVDPNFIVLEALGLRIILNEQTRTGNGDTSQTLVTNAMRINFSNYTLGGRAISGDLIFAQSRATIDFTPAAAIPEPAIWLQLVVGFGLAGTIVRRRRPSLQPAA